MKKITKKTKLSEIMEINENAAEILFNAGMGCIGCSMAMQETLKEGCVAHGMGNEDIDKLIKKLNK